MIAPIVERVKRDARVNVRFLANGRCAARHWGKAERLLAENAYLATAHRIPNSRGSVVRGGVDPTPISRKSANGNFA